MLQTASEEVREQCLVQSLVKHLNVKFLVSGHKQASKQTCAMSFASVELAQACLN